MRHVVIYHKTDNFAFTACHLEAWCLYTASTNRSVTTSVSLGDSISVPLTSGDQREHASSKHNSMETARKLSCYFLTYDETLIIKNLSPPMTNILPCSSTDVSVSVCLYVYRAAFDGLRKSSNFICELYFWFVVNILCGSLGMSPRG